MAKYDKSVKNDTARALSIEFAEWIDAHNYVRCTNGHWARRHSYRGVHTSTDDLFDRFILDKIAE